MALTAAEEKELLLLLELEARTKISLPGWKGRG